MEKQLQTNIEITELKEVIDSFKRGGKVKNNRFEWYYVWHSEKYPTYKIVQHHKVHNSIVELQDDKGWKLFETPMNETSALYNVARVIIADTTAQEISEHRTYIMEGNKAVLLPHVYYGDEQDVVSKEEVEYYKKHPVDIAKERFCYITLKKGLGGSRLFSKVFPAVLATLPEYERQDWIDKTYNIHPCEGKECPYHWCCIRHEVKSVRKYNKMNYCL